MAQEDQKVQDLPDITTSSIDQHIMVITDTHNNQLRKERIRDFIKDFVSSNSENGLVIASDGKLYSVDTTDASKIVSGTLDKNRLPDSGVAAKTYTFPESIEVDEKGIVKSVKNGSPGGNNADKDLSNITDAGIAVIKQNSRSASSLPIGFIGTCAFDIDETKGLRRYLNGSVMTINATTQTFVDKLTQTAALYPSILCTEEQWQTTVTLSAFGQCGQFVLDNEAGTVRLPKIITPIQGLTDLTNLAKLVEAGLPNITGVIKNNYVGANGGNIPLNGWDQGNGTDLTSADNVAVGALSDLNGGQGGTYTPPYPSLTGGFSLDASKSNPIYGKSDTVQPEAVQYPYFIQIATGVDEEMSITNTFEINNPYTLLQPIWSDKKLNNLSWLRSNGQGNTKAQYPAVYDLLLTEYNSAVDETETTDGVEITFRRGASTGLKVTTDKAAFDSILEAAGTAWYYVIDTENEVFYLPQSNGLYQGVNGCLYFYTGETIQNANIVNIGRFEEQLIEKTNASQAAHAAMPGAKRVDLTLGASDTKYTAPADGYFSIRANATAVWGWVNISVTDNNGYGINPTNDNTGAVKGILPVKKGTTVAVSYDKVNNTTLQFIYAQGAQ